jgi:hypothetical protein
MRDVYVFGNAHSNDGRTIRHDVGAAIEDAEFLED